MRFEVSNDGGRGVLSPPKPDVGSVVTSVVSINHPLAIIDTHSATISVTLTPSKRLSSISLCECV